mmetsp:Transcript_3227/g.7534  ORF Transcript_3227/g.7534 Transcript_3227/m.7534 type:complete len:105 (+) Transcript_3227:1800-2114(+)
MLSLYGLDPLLQLTTELDELTPRYLLIRAPPLSGRSGGGHIAAVQAKLGRGQQGLNATEPLCQAEPRRAPQLAGPEMWCGGLANRIQGQGWGGGGGKRTEWGWW